MNDLKVYRLKRVEENLEGRNWDGSVWKSDAEICAESEQRARKVAEENFAILAGYKKGEKCHSPWLDEKYVSCKELDEYKDIPDNECIISPTKYLDTWIER